MDISNNQLLLKRSINVKAVVTPRWREEAQQQLQAQINQLDSQLQQLEMQGQRMIAELRKQTIHPPGPEVMQQIDSIQVQMNEQKSKFLDQKNQSLQQLQQIQTLELEQEVSQGQIESVFAVEKGDNLIRKMQVEVILRDGVIEEIRGEI
ncbi:MAG: YlqD family protein [Limnoraphis sp. WC205]|jgi:predicted RNase H-like nuclease (RuvC/YqgF family)|nr:YlqD family protein [Limnoraphis sp. WC205]